MAIFPIRTFGDPVLRVRTKPVDDFDAPLRRLAEDMIETMYDAPGVGLAAPQIGVSKRICVFDTGERRIEIKRVSYDVETAQRKIRAAGLPDMLAERLACGR